MPNNIIAWWKYNPILQKPTSLDPIRPWSWYWYYGPDPAAGISYGQYHDADYGFDVITETNQVVYSPATGKPMEFVEDVPAEDLKEYMSKATSETAFSAAECTACKSTMVSDYDMADLDQYHCTKCGERMGEPGLNEEKKTMKSATARTKKIQNMKRKIRANIIKQKRAEAAKKTGEELDAKKKAKVTKASATKVKRKPISRIKAEDEMISLEQIMEAMDETEETEETPIEESEMGTSYMDEMEEEAPEEEALMDEMEEEIPAEDSAEMDEYEEEEAPADDAEAEVAEAGEDDAEEEEEAPAEEEEAPAEEEEEEIDVDMVLSMIRKKERLAAAKRKAKAKKAKKAVAKKPVKKIKAEDEAADEEEAPAEEESYMDNIMDETMEATEDAMEAPNAGDPNATPEGATPNPALHDDGNDIEEPDHASEENPDPDEDAESAEAMKFQPLASVDTLKEVKAENIEMVMFGEDTDNPTWHVSVAGVPAARIQLAKQQAADEIRAVFISDDYAANLVSHCGKSGFIQAMNTVNAEFWANHVSNAQIANRFEKSAESKFVGERKKLLATYQENFRNCLDIVTAGMSKNFYPEMGNPLKESLFTNLKTVGLPEQTAQSAIEKSFQECAAQYFSSLFNKAEEYMNMNPEARKEVAKAISAGSSLDHYNNQDDLTSQESASLADRVAKASLVPAATAGGALNVTAGLKLDSEDYKSQLKSIWKPKS